MMEQARTNRALDLALVLLLGAGAFWDGLYAPGQQLLPVLILSLVVLRMRRPALLSRVEVGAILLFAAGVALSLREPVSAGTAAHGPLVAGGWLLALLIGRLSARTGVTEKLLARIWAWSGTFMVFGGLAAMSYLPPHHSGRLAGFLGYPIAVGMLGLLGLTGSLPDLHTQRWWAPLLAFTNGLGLILSGSRGVWAAAVLLGLYLAWARPALLRGALLPVAAALAAALWAGPAVAERLPVPALVALVSGCLTVLAASRFQARRAIFGAAWLGLFAAGALAPGWNWFLGRAAALPLTEGSSVERLTFVKDGVRLLLEIPLGAGYRAWTALHLQGASYGYYSAEVHSALLETGLSFGWLGLAGFVLLSGRFLWHLRHGRGWAPERLVALVGLGALFLHSLLDWDLSFGLFMIPLWLGFGLVEPSLQLGVRLSFDLQAACAGILLAGAVLVGTGDIFTAESERALAAGRMEMAYLHAKMATAVTPWNDLAHAAAGKALAGTGRPAEAVAALQRARALGPREPQYADLLARALGRAGRPREAAEAYRDLVRLWPWEAGAYEVALEAHMELRLRAQVQGDEPLAADLTESARWILAALDQQKALEPPGMPRRPMQTDSAIIRMARSTFGAP